MASPSVANVSILNPTETTNIINPPAPLINTNSATTTTVTNTTKSNPSVNVTLANTTTNLTTVTSSLSSSVIKPPTPPQKLFLRPGTIEEEEETPPVGVGYEEGRFFSRVDSPLLFRNPQPYVVAPPGTPGLLRVSTYNSSLTVYATGRHDSGRSRFRPGAVRKVRRRAVFKNGDCNILQSRISRHRIRFLQDIFTTLVDTQWRWTLLVFALSFLLSWLGFAVIWWLIALTHGDLEPLHLPKYQSDENWMPCVSQIESFTSCFLFSIETQHTIGYGFRATTEECPEAIFVMCLQSIVGVVIQALMVGIVFAKMTRPKHRTQTLLFSKNSVICQRDGQLCLMFRVGDMRKSHIIGASIRAQLIRPRTTKEGEELLQYQTELEVNADGCDGDLFFIWPMTIVHKIDQNSPLYYLSAGDMLQDRFEVVVILEGTIESTGQTTQARSSYVASEVLWGHRFESVVSYNKERQGYEVDYSRFDSTMQVDTPLCSGADLAEFYRIQDHDTRAISYNSQDFRLPYEIVMRYGSYDGPRYISSIISNGTPKTLSIDERTVIVHRADDVADQTFHAHVNEKKNDTQILLSTHNHTESDEDHDQNSSFA